jgi:hypothetical protein
MKLLRTGFIAALVLIITSLAAFGQRKVSALFIGNSLTYFNDLPSLVKTIASCDNVIMNCRTLALPDYALEDHWNDGDALQAIKTRKYSFVVMQQGPSSQQEGRELLLDYSSRFAKVCKQNNTMPCLFMVWPSKARSFDFDGVYKSYKLAADSVNGILCPAGEAWRNLWSVNPEFNLYGKDNFHPNYNGSLLAALVIYASIMKKDNIDFVRYEKVKGNELSKSEFEMLLQAANRVLRD